MSWNTVPGAAGYELQESQDPEFKSGVTTYLTTNFFYNFFKNPALSYGNFYYRLRSNVPEGGANNYGSFGPKTSVYVPQMDAATLGFIKNDSCDTTCAEMDNINISLVHTNTKAYRLTVTHPNYLATLRPCTTSAWRRPPPDPDQDLRGQHRLRSGSVRALQVHRSVTQGVMGFDKVSERGTG